MIDKELKLILDKMCEMVGADPNKMVYDQDGWFRKYTWTQEVENKFRLWLIKYLKAKKGLKARKLIKLYHIPGQIEKAVNEFILCYGWRTKEDDVPAPVVVDSKKK